VEAARFDKDSLLMIIDQ